MPSLIRSLNRFGPRLGIGLLDDCSCPYCRQMGSVRLAAYRDVVGSGRSAYARQKGKACDRYTKANAPTPCSRVKADQLSHAVHRLFLARDAGRPAAGASRYGLHPALPTSRAALQAATRLRRLICGYRPSDVSNSPGDKPANRFASARTAPGREGITRLHVRGFA